MGIVLAVLLLFGGFTLGSVTADKGSDDKQSTTVSSHVEGAADFAPGTQAMRQDDPTGCHSDEAVTYRDLTVPYRDHSERPAVEGSDCDGECPNE